MANYWFIKFAKIDWLTCPHTSQPVDTHPAVDILAAAVLKLLLETFLQEVDAKLEAEVLLLQVIEVL